MHTRDNELEFACAALNRANQFANELEAILRATFAPLVGQKVLKADGALLDKVAKLLPTFPNTVQTSVYAVASRYSLAWNVKTCEFIPPHGCTYQEAGIYVGILEGQTLKELYEASTEPRRTDYSADEIRHNRQMAKEAKQLYLEACGRCEPFGE